MKCIGIVMSSVIFWSCSSLKKNESIPNLHSYMLQLASRDTSFSYGHDNLAGQTKSYSTQLPDSIIGKNTVGEIKLYSLIDVSGKVVKIDIIEVRLRNKKTSLIFGELGGKKAPVTRGSYVRLYRYLQEYVQSIPVKRRTLYISDTLHPTLCILNFK